MYMEALLVLLIVFIIEQDNKFDGSLIEREPLLS